MFSLSHFRVPPIALYGSTSSYQQASGVMLFTRLPCLMGLPVAKRWASGMALLLCLVTVMPHGVAAATLESSYKLGAADKLRIYVHEWPALTGEFSVGYDGKLSLPLIGELAAAGMGTSDLAAAISKRLQTQQELNSLPNTSVEVTQYRPFYILGGVERPGEYPYRPGMTILNAMSIAGGIYRPPEMNGWSLQHDAIQAAGDAQSLTTRRYELLAREARLKAEADQLDTVTFPPLPAEPGTESTFAMQERLLFEARQQQFRKEVNSIGQSIKLYQDEIQSLQAQIDGEAKQIATVQRELDDARASVARGVSPTSRVLPLERTIAEVQTRQGEHETAIIRAKQQINEAQQKLASAGDTRRAKAITDLETTQGELKELTQRYETAQRILLGAAAGTVYLHDKLTKSQTPNVNYTIVRPEGGEMRERDASETTTVEPGDVIKVRLGMEGAEQLGSQSPVLGPQLTASVGGSNPDISKAGAASSPDIGKSSPLKQIGQGAPASGSAQR